jgi:uncharacterized protein (DUF1501 family)
MTRTRREFLQLTGSALTAASVFPLFNKISQVEASQTTDYKALCCIFLHGGNDSYNNIVPVEQDEYTYYSNVRSNLAVPKEELLNVRPASHNRQFGFNPSLKPLHNLFAQNRLAVLCNVGSLVAPINKTEYHRSVASRPLGLFGHYQQQNFWQDLGASNGWGYSIYGQTGSRNPSPQIPMLVNVAGANAELLSGIDGYLTLKPGTRLTLQGFGTTPENNIRYRALRQILSSNSSEPLSSVTATRTSKAIDDGLLTARVLASAIELKTIFPSTNIGQQMMQISRLILAREALGTNRRQIFYATLGGFDTHNAQLASHPTLLKDLSEAMAAFYEATVEMGLASNVTTFTLSEFGRTIQNSDGGTDHGWGTHCFVMGGAVRGGDFYGQYPSIVIGGEQDIDSGAQARGRIIPTTSVDQYAATLASWFGVSRSDLEIIFPNLGRFSQKDLGFFN